MIRIRNLLTYRLQEKEPVFTGTNSGDDNHTPIYLEEPVITMDVKRNKRDRVLLALGGLVRRVTERFQHPCINKSDKNSNDIDFTVTPL